jgi:cytochrome c2
LLESAPRRPLPPAIPGDDVAKGKALFMSSCVTCHGVTWTTETLEEFLANTNAKVPDTAMIGMLVDPQQRAEVIAYLATLKE